MTAIVTKRGFMDMQVCVPNEWTDEQVVVFANQQNPAGTELEWAITRTGDPILRGDPERNPCQDAELSANNIHIMLHC